MLQIECKMTVGELIEELSQYDPELELKIEDAFGIEFHFDSLWNYDNETNELNTYLTMTIAEQ